MIIYAKQKFNNPILNKNLIKLDLWLVRTNFILLIFLFVSISIFISYFFVLIAFLLNQPEALSRNDLDRLNIQETFWVAIIFAPMFETFIFQFCVIKLFNRLFKNYFLGIVVSAIFFGFNHSFSIIYVINTVFIGILLGYAFVVCIKRNGYPFWTVFLIHALINFIVFIIKDLQIFFLILDVGLSYKKYKIRIII